MSSKLKSVRAAHRGVVTRLLNRVNGNPEELLREHNVNGLSTIRDLIRNKEKTILELDAKILEETSEDEHGEEISEADRSFRSVGDEIFIQAFEDATLPFEDWTHEAHLRMAWNYITEHGKEGAIPHIRLGIQHFNEQNKDKVKFGFHETITMFYIAEVSHAIKQSLGVGSFEEFLEKNPYLLDKTVIAQYYSHKHLYSDAARHQFVQPDLKPLPS